LLNKLGECRALLRLPIQWLPLLAIAAALMPHATAQEFTTTVPGDIMGQYRDLRTNWTTNVWVYANRLFGFLALIEFGWSVIALALDKTDLQSWTAGLIRKLMWIGAFYALLINGRIWIPAIIDSFEIVGTEAAGIGAPLSPGDVFGQGIGIAAALMDAGSTSAFFTNPGSSLALVFAAVIIVISYIIITVNFIVTMVESYLAVSVGFIFLGFGGSRWTAPYVERYIGLAVSIGVKIVLLYCLISGGQSLGIGWLTEAQGIGTAEHPSMTAFDVMGAAVIYMMLCWHIPKLFGAVLGGAPALTGGDLIATGLAVAGAGYNTVSLGTGAIAAAAAAGAVSGTVAGGSSGGSAVSDSALHSVGSASTAAAIRPPERSMSGAATPANVRPPSARATLDALGGEELAGSGFEGQTAARGFASPVIETGPASGAGDAPPVNTGDEAQGSRPHSGGQYMRRKFASAATKADSALNELSRRLADTRRGLGRISDGGPSSSPPRMPIDHHD
jgi:type IV secretion system protein TrbL